MPKKTAKEPYINNPFTVALSGLTLLFNAARGMAIFLFILCVIGAYSTPIDQDSAKQYLTTAFNTWDVSDWTIAIISVFFIILAVAMISALISGASAYTSAKLAAGETAAIKDAFRESFERLWSYLWLQVIVTVKLILWTLLFILPGIYMTFRYSLANVAFFDDKKQLKGNAAIKESLRLTKGVWITTFASYTLFNAITFSFIADLVNPGVSAILYRQFNQYTVRPKTHALSIATLGIAIFLSAVAIAALFGLAIISAFIEQ